MWPFAGDVNTASVWQKTPFNYRCRSLLGTFPANVGFQRSISRKKSAERATLGLSNINLKLSQLTDVRRDLSVPSRDTQGSNFYWFDSGFECTRVWSGIRSETFFDDRNISVSNVLQNKCKWTNRFSIVSHTFVHLTAKFRYKNLDLIFVQVEQVLFAFAVFFANDDWIDTSEIAVDDNDLKLQCTRLWQEPITACAKSATCASKSYLSTFTRLHQLDPTNFKTTRALHPSPSRTSFTLRVAPIFIRRCFRFL